MDQYKPGNTIGTWTNVYSADDRVPNLPIAAGRTHKDATNIKLSGYGHSDLHTVGAYGIQHFR